MQNKVVICRFFLKDRTDRPGQKQLQCFLGDHNGGTVYVVDLYGSPIKERQIKVGVFYFCKVRNTLAQGKKVSVVSVAVIEEINFSEGIWKLHHDPDYGNQSQCHQSGKAANYVLVVARSCTKQPKTSGEKWTFDLHKVVMVHQNGNVLVMSVLLKEQVLSGRAKRRREKKTGVEVAA